MRQFYVKEFLVSLWGVLENLRQHNVVLQEPLERKNDVGTEGEGRLCVDLTFIQIFFQFRIFVLFRLKHCLSLIKVGAVFLIDRKSWVNIQKNISNISALLFKFQ